MILINTQKINAYLIALYVFQFGLLQPIASLVNSQLPIAVFTIILLLIALINNFKIKKYLFFTFLIIGIYFLTNALIYETNIVIPIYFEFLLKCFSAFLFGSLVFKSEYLYNAFLKVSVFNFFAICLYPFVNFLDSMNYMRFGYALIPSTLVFLIASIFSTKRKLFWCLLFLISLFLNVVYGSRGVLLVLIIFIILLFIFSKQIKPIIKIISISLILFISYIFINYNLLSKFINYLYYDLGISTYSIMKLNRMISGEFFESLSGRDKIYSTTWSYIENNLFFGYGIGFSRTISGSTTHNIFLQILSESGFLGFCIWFIIFLFCMYKFIKISFTDRKLFLIVCIIASISIGRLLVSSDMWLRPEFWLVLSILFNFKTKSNTHNYLLDPNNEKYYRKKVFKLEEGKSG